MALAEEDIEQIQALIQKAIVENPAVVNANVRYELELRERTIRVEEELKHQRELMQAGFAQMEKRFEQVDKRFELIEKRFEQIDKRFEQVDKRFEQVDKRFEVIERQLEKQNQAIFDVHLEIKQQMKWTFGMLIAVSGLIITTLKLIL